MLLILPRVTTVVIEETDLDAAQKHHETEFGCELCLVAQAIMRNLRCAVALVGFDGATVFQTPQANPFRAADDGAGVSYTWPRDALRDLILAYDAGDFGAVRRALPLNVRLERVEA